MYIPRGFEWPRYVAFTFLFVARSLASQSYRNWISLWQRMPTLIFNGLYGLWSCIFWCYLEQVYIYIYSQFVDVYRIRLSYDQNPILKQPLLLWLGTRCHRKSYFIVLGWFKIRGPFSHTSSFCRAFHGRFHHFSNKVGFIPLNPKQQAKLPFNCS